MMISNRAKRSFMLTSVLLISVCPPFLNARADNLKGWPQDHSDIQPDPNAHFGILPNGMHYIVVHNATPPHQAALRFRIGSGSAEETDAEQGLAHVLEHMSFKGSKHVPAGEMIHILERKGLAFGADTNAQTGFDATTFQLDLPETSEDTLHTGLMLMRETASELTLDDAALEPERGVVLSEERLRDTPQYRASTALTTFMMPGQLAAQRFPIGKVDVVEHAPVSLLRQFYEANYRPERATLVAVGDFDADAMIASIKAMFSDWKPVGPPTSEPVLGNVAARGLTAKVVKLPGDGTKVKLIWVQPFDDSIDNKAKEKRGLLEMLGTSILNERLSRKTTQKDPPFLEASAFVENIYNSAKISGLASATTTQGWKAGMDEIILQARQITQFGVTQAELDRALSNLSANLERAKASASTVPSAQIIDAILSNVETDGVYTNPAQDLTLFNDLRPTFTIEAVDASLKQMFSGSGPLVEMSTPSENVTEAMLLLEFKAASAVKLTDAVATTAAPWPYTDFGVPTKVVSLKHINDLDFTQIEFANHVRLNIKKTAFRKDQILVQVNLGRGRLGMAKDQPSMLWATKAFISGGLGKLSLNDIQDAAAGKAIGADFSMDSDSFHTIGRTVAKDLPFQLQLMAAYIKDPGFRETALEQARANTLAAYPQISATPEGVLGLNLKGLLHSGDKRWEAPTPEQIAETPADALKKVLRPVLQSGSLEISIVGDVDIDTAIKQVAATFGALPERADTPLQPAANIVHFPAPTSTPVELVHNGRDDQTIALVAWPAPDLYSNVQTDRALVLAQEIFKDRLTAQMRMKQGATYSPQGIVNLSPVLPHYGYIEEMVETKPEYVDDFFQIVQNISTDMATKGVTDDELLRAKAPNLEQRKHLFVDNQFWLGVLSGSQREPRQLDAVRTLVKGMEKIDAAQVQQAAAQFLKNDAAWKLVVRP